MLAEAVERAALWFRTLIYGGGGRDFNALLSSSISVLVFTEVPGLAGRWR